MVTKQRDDVSATRLTWRRTFGFAFQGILYTFVHERNIRVHLMGAYGVLLFCLITRPALGVVAATTALCFFVLASEVFNTAVEALTDLATTGAHHPLAKVAKDAAAGGVLLISLASVCVGVWIVASGYPWSFALFSDVHPLGAGLVLLVLVILTLLVWKAARFHASAANRFVAGRRRRPDE